MTSRRAFTYIELTIVMFIIAVLAAIAIPNFLEAKVRSAVARSQADLAMLGMCIDTYRLEHRMHPLNSTPGKADGWDLKALTTPIAYMMELPMDSMTRTDIRGGRHPLPKLQTPYNYFNAVQIDSENGLKVAATPDGEMPGYYSALVWGLGPGSALRAEKTEPVTKFREDGRVEVLHYDATNGTTSSGDIYRPVP